LGDPRVNGNAYPASWYNELIHVTHVPIPKYADELVQDVEKIFNDYAPQSICTRLTTFPYLSYANKHLHKEYGGTYCAQVSEILTKYPARYGGFARDVSPADNLSNIAT